jgi:nucleotide-binding universal stress UspA family protein
MVKNYKRILVPLDNSKYSERALAEAITIAKKFDSKLYLLNVVSDSPIEPFDMSLATLKGPIIHKTTQQLLNSTYETAHFILDRKSQECKKAGVDVEYKVLTGKPAESILKFTTKNDIDLLIIGCQGLGGIKKIKTLGSVSRKVSENAPCPVMLIH